MNKNSFSISNRLIGADEPPFIIAEMSGNHNGELARACDLVVAAAEAGADAIKLQTYTADTITIKSDRSEFNIDTGLWAGRSLHELYEEAHTPWDWHEKLFKLASEKNVIIFSSPFDNSAVDFLEKLNAPAYKIASFEIIDIPLIERVAKTGKPMIISSGMATKEEIEEAIKAYKNAGGSEVGLLHCTSGYPTPFEQSNLLTMVDKAKQFDVDVIGLSDHTTGIEVPVAAVALGAKIIEKHFCLRRADGGVDSDFSLEPDEFKQMASACKNAALALGNVSYELKPSEVQSRKARRSLYVINKITKGDKFKPEDVRSIRPANGLHPRHLNEIIGKIAACDIDAGTPLNLDMVE